MVVVGVTREREHFLFFFLLIVFVFYYVYCYLRPPSVGGVDRPFSSWWWAARCCGFSLSFHLARSLTFSLFTFVPLRRRLECIASPGAALHLFLVVSPCNCLFSSPCSFAARADRNRRRSEKKHGTCEG